MARHPPFTVVHNKEILYSDFTNTFSSAIECVSALTLSVHLFLCKGVEILTCFLQSTITVEWTILLYFGKSSLNK
jgi:hypothetical protein